MTGVWSPQIEKKKNDYRTINAELPHKQGNTLMFVEHIQPLVLGVSQFLPGQWVLPAYQTQIWKYEKDYNMASIKHNDKHLYT